MKDLQGRVAVVTGAASGIGAALAARFGQEGMKVVLADIETERLDEHTELLRAQGIECEKFRCDVADRDQVEQLAAFAVERFGGLNVACNNAGVSNGGLTWELDSKDWDWVLGVNLGGVLNGIAAFVPRIVASGEGHIVNTASMAGFVAAPGMGPYTASKHAVVAISETLYHELRMVHPTIGASVLCPGWVRTRIAEAERNRPSQFQVDGRASSGAESLRDMVNALIEGGLNPADVAGMVVDAIVGEKFWVFTHQDWLEGAKKRYERIFSGENPQGGFPGLAG